MRALALFMMASAMTATAQTTDTLQGAVWIEGVLADARAVRVDLAGRVYVADPGHSALFVFASDGALHRTVTGGGSPSTTLREPVDIDPTNGLLLYVADSGAGRIFPVGEDGLFLEPLGGGAAPRLGSFEEPSDDESFAPVAVETTVHGDVLVVDALHPRLTRWDASRRRTVLSGSDAGGLVDPRALAVMNERIYVLDRASVVVFDVLGTRLGRFAHSDAHAALRVRRMGDRIVLVHPQRLSVYDSEGRLEATRLWMGPPLRDAALTPRALLLLTAEALYRLPR